MNNENSALKLGILSGAGAYIIWGLLPLYWKLLDHVPSEEVLAHRIIWSLVFVALLLLLMGKGKGFINEWKKILKQPRLIAGVTAAAVLITGNWYIYIWSVANERVVEASLGYYINPLVSVLLGVIFLKERLLKVQWVSVILAGVAVTILTAASGSFPYVALGLAFSFGLYGLTKKIVQVGALNGVALETLIMIPLAAGFLIIQHGLSSAVFYAGDTATFWLLAGAGAATAVPLLLFGAGAKRIPLSLMGFLQYVAPTMMLLLGIFLYGETFTAVHLAAYSIIWIALIMFTASRWVSYRKTRYSKKPVITGEEKTAVTAAKTH
ncbi:EamA family transporter RarD [Evansella sp. LMS18]|uniref:EamA family transporter RarD n=1 Tax=Evansella sp. LMS18 TaxID=2924033 RepID=UPI0020D015E5|nr:EamA family transporter RarD [Evansella sp. LMS18]UTR09727.1 EamA family transporter RarD [Evansella sp. LMS18]